MGVKDFVQLYESPTSQRRYGHPQQVDEAESKNIGHDTDLLPPPRPARFIKRSQGSRHIPPAEGSPILPSLERSALPTNPSSKALTKFHDNDSSQSLHKLPVSQIQTALSSSTITSSHYTQTLIADINNDGESHLKHTYPPLDPCSDRNNSTLKGPLPVHQPIPALIVLSRNAHPLNLPKLDHYLASISSSPLGQDDNDNSGVMFPPLDQLAKTRLSIDDLENNATVAPLWRNPVSILGFLQNLMIAFLVS